jgi:Rap1a immunity proteins
MLKFTASAMFLVISWSAHAQQTTGELFAQCEVYERPRLNAAQDKSAASCFAYFTAVHQLASLYLDGGKVLNFVCLPNNGPDIAKLIQVFMTYARANPLDRRASAVGEVTNALAHAFPCK